MKDSSFLVILVLLVALIGGGGGIYLVKKRAQADKLVLCNVNDLRFIEVFPSIDISLASDEGAGEDLDFATSCYRIVTDPALK